MGRVRKLLTIGAMGLVGAVAAVAPAAATPAETAPSTTTPPVHLDGGTIVVPTIGDALEGTLDDLSASAVGGFGAGDTYDVTVSFTNEGDEPVELAVARGTLLEPEDPSAQTAVIAGPVDEDPTLAMVGVDPTITVPPGESEVALVAYCSQANDAGPFGQVPLTYVGVAEDPLPRVLHNAVVAGADPLRAQDAVWWVTDAPYVPVSDELGALLEGVDVEEFAAAPRQVVADETYVPQWRDPYGADGSISDGTPGGRLGGATSALIVGLLAIGALGFVIYLFTSSRPPAAVAQRAAGPPPGWHPDPHGSGQLRWWDGTRWTGQVRRR